MAGVPLGRPIPQAIDDVVVYLEGDFQAFNFRGGSYINSRDGHFVHCFNNDAHYVFESSSLFQLYKIAYCGLRGLV